MIRDIASYISYLDRIRQRTLAVVDTIPDDKFDWTPRAGEFTIGDLVRHLCAAEKMDVAAALGKGWHYAGHRADAWGETRAAVRENLARVHAESIAVLRAAGDALLETKQPDLKGNPTSAWRMLMAMIEHEIHHRSQLSFYLTLLDVPPPQLFGVRMEELPVD